MTADLATPVFFAEFFDTDGSRQYAQVRLCTKRAARCGVYHFNNAYTYVSNGAHVDEQMDNVVRVHYVETFDKLRMFNPSHPVLPENRKAI